MSENIGAVLYGINDLRIEKLPMPTPKEDELMIRVYTTSICGSDQHFLREGHLGTFGLTAPTVLGHECSGVVMAVGSTVERFNVGDRVCIEPPVPCWRCLDYCKKGKYHLCGEVKAISTPPYHGTFRRYLAHPASCCWKIPDSFSMETAALIEPLAVALHGCRRAGVRAGHKVLICGAGSIGIMSLLTARACGATKIAVTDENKTRLKIAADLGADLVLDISKMSEEEMAHELKEEFGALPDVTLDCVLFEMSVRNAINLTNRGGSIGLVGMGTTDANVNIFDIIAKELNVYGVLRYVNLFPTTIDLVASGAINLNHVPSVEYPLEKAKEAFDRALEGDVVKVYIKSFCDEETSTSCKPF